jgi:diguanylate cyclase (GGDEF)-like protein/PAS domain S-box-containing protein
MDSVESKFDEFLSSIFETHGPEGVVSCFKFLFGAFEISRDGIVIAANDAFLSLTQYSRSELYGMRVLDLIAEDERESMLLRFAKGDTDQYELKLFLKNEITIDVLVSPRIFYVRGEIYRLAEFIDNSVQKKIVDDLKKSEEKFHAVFEQAAVGIARVSPTGVFLEANEKLCEILGYRKSELMGKTFQEFTHPDELASGLEFVQNLLEGERESFSTEKRYIGRHGQTVWASLTVSLIRSADGAPKYFVAVLSDIGARKEMEQELINRATHDSLTGLLNRTELAKALEKEAARAGRYSRPFSLLMLDIDHFKLVNDDCGHQVGDRVLVELAGILEEAIRTADFVGRFGGEEFLLILPELNHEKALELAERIRKQVESHTIITQDQVIKISISIGVSTYPEHGNDVDALVKASDDAMYKAKANGRNQVASAN